MNVWAPLVGRIVIALVLAGLVGCGAPESREPARARAELRGDSTLVGIFRDVEKQTGVPAELLATIAQIQSRLGMHLADTAAETAPGHDHGAHAPPEYGLMAIGTGALTDLETAALLAGLAPEDVAKDPRANVRAAAAILARAGHARGVVRGDDVLAWARVAEAYGGEALAREAIALLRKGWSGTDDDGFRVEVVGIGDGPGSEELAEVAQALGYPGALWSPAYSGNYQAASRGASSINYVIIHTVQGSYAGCISWFKNSSANVSAHYVVRSSDGQITQMVDDSDIAWHDACFNSQSIGIEHEGYVSDPAKWYTDAMYKSSAKLVSWLADQYGIPKDKAHIMGHNEAPDCSDHTDPGPGWNWSYYMELVKNGGCAPKAEVCNGQDDDCDGKADEDGVCNEKPKGWLDSVSCDGIGGWSQDPDAPTKSIDVHVYFGGPAGSGAKGFPLSASQKRDDLCSAIGSCEHGFGLTPPKSLLDGQNHPIHAYGIDSAGGPNAELSGSPKMLNCKAPAPTGVRRHVQNMDSFNAWKLDTFWDALPLGDAEIAALEEADAWPATPKLVKADDGSPEVWLVDGKWRRHVSSPEVLAAWGFSFDDVTTSPAAEVKALWEGPKLRPEPVLLKSSDGRIDLIDDAMPEPTAIESTTPGKEGWGGEGGTKAGSSGGSPKPAAASDDEPAEGSCACRTSGPAKGGGSLSLFVLLGLAFARRRVLRAAGGPGRASRPRRSR